MDGLRMLKEEDTDSNRDIGVLHCGKFFRYSKKETVAEREEKHRVFEKRDPYVVLQITPYREIKGSPVQSNRIRNSISYQNLCRTHDPVCAT
jgi:hypothetical protein